MGSSSFWSESLDYWVNQVQLGVPLQHVPKSLRARVARRLGLAGNLPAEDSPEAPEGQQGGLMRAVEQPARAAWRRGTAGLVLAMVLPFIGLAVLLWFVGRLPERAGGAGFVEGLGKVKLPAGAGGAGSIVGQAV